MSFFDEVGKKITDVGQGTIQKTKNLADVAKLNSAISEEEQKIKTSYEQIGRVYAVKYRENPDPEVADFVKTVVMSEQKIAEYNRTIQEIKGLIPCPRCGSMVDRESMICPVCGQQMPRKEQPQAAAYCTACGAAIVAGQKFCVSCGTPVYNPASQVTPQETQTQTAQDVPVSPETTEDEHN